MRKLFIFFLFQIGAIFLTLGISMAQSTDNLSGRIEEVKVPAPALTGNLLKTPDIQNVAVYLPPGYDKNLEQNYAVIYLLHGIFDDRGVWSENYKVPEILDRLISTGKIPELIVVMPDGGNKYGGGYYRNSSVSGHWADYIADDLVSFIDENFRTLAKVDSRAIIGHSMGGYGALNLAMTQPGVFSVVWALSPCCLSARDDLSFGNDAWKRAAAVNSEEDLLDLIEKRDFYPIATIGILNAFSPNAKAPPVYANFPFDIVRGEVVLDDLLYDRYLDALPSRQVHNARKALRDLRGLAIGVGLGDQFLHIPTGTLEFSHRLGQERIPHRLDVYAGDHRQHVSERLENIILPWTVQKMVVSNVER
ncbi:alpha/beta hydrolase [Lentilitoribacter sp. EG35]|jgi:enterochelin esterase-like enzyme|uniref:alpha/beta hydrolase n=1 Tax=Lentilitoribacter sp. EG35 TaxID=3234192 RepID=UPI0034605009